MRILNIVFSLLVLISSLTFSQKRYFTVEDAVMKSYSTLQPTTLPQLQWIPTTNSFSFIDTTNGKQLFVRQSVKTKEFAAIVNWKEIETELQDYKLQITDEFPTINWMNESEFKFKVETHVFSYDVKAGKINLIAKLPDTADNDTLCYAKRFTAFTDDNNLFFVFDDEQIKSITNNKDKNIVRGQFVSRNEFSIKGGIFRSPKSNYIAFYQKDESKVGDYPITDYIVIPAEAKNIKYPMAGGPSEKVSVGIYDIEKDRTVWLKTGGPYDKYLTSVRWGPEEEFVYVSQLNRDQNHLRLIKYNVENGEPENVLFEESDDKYIEPDIPLQFLPHEDNKFIWFSERDGWNHIYLYNTNGEFLKQVTKGEWVVTKYLGFDTEGENIFFMGTKKEPLENHFYKVNIQSSEITRLTNEPGLHFIKLSSDRKYFIDEFNSREIPNKIILKDISGKEIRVLHESENALEKYEISKPEIFTIKNEESTKLYCRLIKPVDFDESKKYPVILYVYGGPHSQLIKNQWYKGKYHFWFQLMAQKGFLIFTLDNRGTAQRGLEFEQAIFKNLGKVEIEDQMTGINYLKSQSFVDTNRIGIYGWSYGGFMTTSLMLKHNDIFKVGVAGGPVIDWSMYEVMYGERYMATPQTNPEGYEKSNLLNYVDRLKGKLLIVQGTSDPTVVWQHSLLFAKKAMNLNVPLDYYPYIGYEHHVKGRDKIHLYQKITDYFLDNL